MKIIVSLFLVTTLFQFSCKGTQNNKEFTSTSTEILEFLGSEDVTMILNSSKTHNLIFTKDSPNGPLKFVVVSKTGEIVLKKAIRDGDVRWQSERTIEIKESLGVATPEDNGKKIYTINISSE